VRALEAVANADADAMARDRGVRNFGRLRTSTIADSSFDAARSRRHSVADGNNSG
jgi:hypothetical protein